jgi:hypothetical protein
MFLGIRPVNRVGAAPRAAGLIDLPLAVRMKTVRKRPSRPVGPVGDGRSPHPTIDPGKKSR